jgi:hypothetical protein
MQVLRRMVLGNDMSQWVFVNDLLQSRIKHLAPFH